MTGAHWGRVQVFCPRHCGRRLPPPLHWRKAAFMRELLLSFPVLLRLIHCVLGLPFQYLQGRAHGESANKQAAREGRCHRSRAFTGGDSDEPNERERATKGAARTEKFAGIFAYHRGSLRWPPLPATGALASLRIAQFWPMHCSTLWHEKANSAIPRRRGRASELPIILTATGNSYCFTQSLLQTPIVF